MAGPVGRQAVWRRGGAHNRRAAHSLPAAELQANPARRALVEGVPRWSTPCCCLLLRHGSPIQMGPPGCPETPPPTTTHTHTPGCRPPCPATAQTRGCARSRSQCGRWRARTTRTACSRCTSARPALGRGCRGAQGGPVGGQGGRAGGPACSWLGSVARACLYCSVAGCALVDAMRPPAGQQARLGRPTGRAACSLLSFPRRSTPPPTSHPHTHGTPHPPQTRRGPRLGRCSCPSCCWRTSGTAAPRCSLQGWQGWCGLRARRSSAA